MIIDFHIILSFESISLLEGNFPLQCFNSLGIFQSIDMVAQTLTYIHSFPLFKLPCKFYC